MTKDPWQRYGWLLPLGWLIFLAYPIVQLVGSGAPVWQLALAWSGLLLFAASYVLGFVIGMRAGWGNTPRIVYGLFFAQLGFAALALPVLGWGALAFLPFVMSYACYGLRGWWHWVTTVMSVLLATLSLILAEPAGGTWPIFAIVVVLAIVNTVNGWMIARGIRAEELRVDLATSRERETVARDVHDLIGHTLTVVKLKAELAERLVDRDPNAAKHELQEITALTAEAIAGVRSTVTGLLGPSLSDQLEASGSALESAGIRLTIDGSPQALSPAQSITASWVLREAVTNVLRHAGASLVTVRLLPGTLTVHDDGCGISEEAGNGIYGMAERASTAGAEFIVNAPEQGGTLVSLRW